MKKQDWSRISVRKYLPQDESFPENRLTSFLRRVGAFAQRHPAGVLLFLGTLLAVLFTFALVLSAGDGSGGSQDGLRQSYREQLSREAASFQKRLEQRGQRPLEVSRTALEGSWLGLEAPSSRSEVARWMAFRPDGEYNVIQGGLVGLGRWSLSSSQAGSGKARLTVRSRFYGLKGNSVGSPQNKVFYVRLSQGKPGRLQLPRQQQRGLETVPTSGEELYLSTAAGETYIFARPRRAAFDEPRSSRWPSN